MKVKQCSKCREVKSVDQFYKSGRCVDGLQYHCVGCYKKDRLANRDAILERDRKYYQENKEYHKEKVREWYEANRDRVHEYRLQWAREKRAEDPLYKFMQCVRTTICHSFVRASRGTYVKKSKSLEILGCEFDFFIQHISQQFQEGMTINNHGLWHLDHIVPISSAKTEEEVLRLNHYTNFQPLWAKDNLAKGAKILQ